MWDLCPQARISTQIRAHSSGLSYNKGMSLSLARLLDEPLEPTLSLQLQPCLSPQLLLLMA